ncbi:uncharacterized protein GIQ15_02918 [Arthroderma uncinatum]|uniref:uncharacterized protein n=1 Tax=Arthroderma uncinatum TaxID=74035 RepID=UPI00144A9AAB|nr:uncharacterized protein GIQ15_02918 [Arthroderma uncinatum]KAF3483594.1 hypothetical protein GIQ15_02918 [Arthroderma uncinatum]
MDELPTRPRPKKPLTLNTVPVEIQEAILSHLDSINTLKLAAASCRSLRDLLLYHPNGIIKGVLRSSIPDAVFPEALAVFKSSRLPSTDTEAVQALLNDYFKSLEKVEQPVFSLYEATTLEDFHRLIRRFTAYFISQALSKHPITGAEEERPHPANSHERARTKPQRTSRPARPVIPLEIQSQLFFRRFAPWENEQLACIHDFLLRIVDKAFNDVAAHDVDWGELDIPYNKADEHIPLRERGYVMWSHRRLSRWGLLKTPWQFPPFSSYHQSPEVEEAVLRSHQRRTEIWLKGGRGWWSEDDETMAKGLRSSVKKHNKALLRKQVFGPAADARTERLSAKLRELAGVSKDANMTDVDPSNTDAAEAESTSDLVKDDEPTPLKVEGGISRKTGRIEKRTRRKPRNTMTFAPHPGKVKRAKASASKKR